MCFDYVFTFNVSYEEIKDWMDKEVVRLGDAYKGFEITWARDEFKYWLELLSKVKTPIRTLCDLQGSFLRVGELFDSIGCDPNSILKLEGNRLYYKLNKQYIVYRNLGRFI